MTQHLVGRLAASARPCSGAGREQKERVTGGRGIYNQQKADSDAHSLDGGALTMLRKPKCPDEPQYTGP